MHRLPITDQDVPLDIRFPQWGAYEDEIARCVRGFHGRRNARQPATAAAN